MIKGEKNGNRIGGPPHKGGKPLRKPPQANAPSSRAPDQTFEEVRYLKRLIEQQTPVRLKLEDNSEVSGTIEYYDHSFIRLTREPAEPNLFIYKHEIKYLYEIE
jgi:sRNA-binding regulator protein Hfq